MRYRWIEVWAVTTGFIPPGIRLNTQQSDAAYLIGEGDRLAWLMNWQAAEPYFGEAEPLFREAGDRCAYQIEVLARDSETGRIGTYMGKFTIPNLDREAQRVPITSVVLSSQRAPMAEAIATVGNAKNAAITQAASSLVQAGQKLIPSVTRVFSSKSDMYVYLQAYEPDAATTAQPLLVYVTFFQGATKVMETPTVEVAGP
jgi:hypothetical protein